MEEVKNEKEEKDPGRCWCIAPHRGVQEHRKKKKRPGNGFPILSLGGDYLLS